VSARVSAETSPYIPYAPEPQQKSVSGALVLSMPIFQGGQGSSFVRQRLEENTRDFLLVQDSRRAMVQDITIAWQQLETARLSLKTLEAEVAASEQAFRGVRIEEKFGLRSTIEVLNAQLELQSGQISLVRGRNDEFISRLRLLAAMGTLTPAVLSPGIQPYDPAKNFNAVRNQGMTPLEIPARLIDMVAMPLTAKAGPDRPAVLPDYKATLPPTPENPPILSTTELIEQTDRELVEEGVKPRPRPTITGDAPTLAPAPAQPTTTPSAAPGYRDEAPTVPTNPVTLHPPGQTGDNVETTQAVASAHDAVTTTMRVRFVGPVQ
jgi:hypothetical protein